MTTEAAAELDTGKRGPRLVRLDDVSAVRVPSVDQEAACDLVRAREDARG